MQARDELADVDLLERGGGVGQELTCSSLALAHDRRCADCGCDRERHDDGDRSEQVHRERVGGAGRVGRAADRVLCLLGQQVERLAHLLHRLDVADSGDREQQHERDEHEEHAAEDHHRPPEVARLGELAQVGARDRPHPEPVHSPASLARLLMIGGVVQAPDGEVEIFERRCERLDACHAGAGRHERLDEIGHPGEVVEADERGSLTVELDAEHAIVARERQQRRRVGRRDANDGVGPVAAGELGGRPGDHVTSAFEHDDLIRETFRFEEEMGAHHDRAALAGHLVDEVEHRERRLRVEARGRLVVEQQVRIVEHRPRQRETRLHPGRVAADLLVECMRDAEPLGGRDDAVSTRPVEVGGVREVVASRQAVVERGLRGDDTAPAPHLLSVDAPGRDRAHAPSRSAG